MNEELDIQRLVLYLTGNCSETERELVENWISMSTDNRLLFEEFKLVWETSSSKNNTSIVDVDNAWNDFKARANFVEAVAPSSNLIGHVATISFKKTLYFASTAAAFIIIILGLYFLLHKDNAVKINNYAASTVQPDSPTILPDGSKVVMNKNARISYPSYFAPNTRDVNFVGEAFFNIAHNADKPMIIATGNVRVKVLGTSFDLCNCVDDDVISVYLETGKILFYSIDDIDGSILEQVTLHPGQKAVYNKRTGQIIKSEFNNNNYKAWETGTLEFVNTPMPEVVNVLEHTYRLNITPKVSLSDYKLTARFSNETPNSILQSLQVIFGLNYKIEDDNIVIY